MALLKIKAIYYVSQKAKRLKKTQRKTALLIKMPQGTVFPIFEALFFPGSALLFLTNSKMRKLLTERKYYTKKQINAFKC